MVSKNACRKKKSKLEQHSTNATDEIVSAVYIQTCLNLLAVFRSDDFTAT